MRNTLFMRWWPGTYYCISSKRQSRNPNTNTNQRLSGRTILNRWNYRNSCHTHRFELRTTTVYKSVRFWHGAHRQSMRLWHIDIFYRYIQYIAYQIWDIEKAYVYWTTGVHFNRYKRPCRRTISNEMALNAAAGNSHHKMTTTRPFDLLQHMK